MAADNPQDHDRRPDGPRDPPLHQPKDKSAKLLYRDKQAVAEFLAKHVFGKIVPDETAARIADEAKAFLPFALGQESVLVSEAEEARGLMRVETPREAGLMLRYAADEGEYREALAVLTKLLSPDGPASAGLVAWVRSSMIEAGAKEADVAKVQRLEDLREPVVDSWFAKRFREGRREGRAEGRRATLVRLARRKFGVDTGKKLAALLDGISGPDRLDEVADLIIDCTSGPDLLARAAETS